MKFIYCDGGCHNNQEAAKRMAYGSFLVTSDEYPNHSKSMILCKLFEFGSVTNNVAEYRILQEALQYCINEFIAQPIIFTDSALVANQISGAYKTKEETLKPLRDSVAKDMTLIGAELRQVSRDILVGVLGH